MAFGETDPSEHRGGAGAGQASVPGRVTFSRRELNRILEAQIRILGAIKQQKSEQARTWMEKHIRDFRRGYELEHSKS